MSLRPAGALIVAVASVLALATDRGAAHHSISAKFDDTKPVTLSGIVTLVDWTNPHVHVFVNVRDAEGPGAQLGGRAREPDRPPAERLEPGHAACPATASPCRASRPATAAARRGARRWS